MSIKELSEYWDGHSYGSHCPILYEFLKHIQGPSLELGCGNFSTPLLCDFLKGHTVLSYDGDPVWCQIIIDKKYHSDPKHQMINVNGPNPANDTHWDKIFEDDSLIMQQYWSLIFIDHAGPRRVSDSIILKDKCDFMILHDTDADGHGGAYGWDRLWPHFKYYKHFTFGDPINKPGVTMASNKINVADWWTENIMEHN